MTQLNHVAQKPDLAAYQSAHFNWRVEEGIATLSLNCADRKNPLTFDSYAQMRDLFRDLVYADNINVVIIESNAGNFCSGGDVHDIIGPLVKMNMKELLQFTRMTGDLVKAMLNCGKVIIAAVEGVAVGAGAILAMASDMRIATKGSKTAFLFTRVGLAGCDMGACAILPRIVGQSRAADLLYTGRSMSGEEGERWGFYSRLVPESEIKQTALEMAKGIAKGPNFAHMMTKTQLNHEWNMSVDQAIEAEAQAQAICMQTADFETAYHAFVDKQRPEFSGQ